MKFKGDEKLLHITSKTLSGKVNSYEFRIQKFKGRYLIYIPGYGAGREGPEFPYHKEQESWMRQQSYLKEVWYLTWECKEDHQLRKFIKAVNHLK
ncbi:MAG: hypothetical protein AAF696_03620 [Bacteroidota bacterium]